MTYIRNRDRAAEIRQRMQQIRMGLPTSIGKAKAEVSELTDWKFYVRKFPAILLPVVALTTFALVPEKSVAPVQRTNRLNGKWLEKNTQPEQLVAKKSFMAGVASAAAGVALRSITAYATRRFSVAIHDLYSVPSNGNSFKSATQAAAPRRA